jgi:hypothetical protein
MFLSVGSVISFPKNLPEFLLLPDGPRSPVFMLSFVTQLLLTRILQAFGFMLRSRMVQEPPFLCSVLRHPTAVYPDPPRLRRVVARCRRRCVVTHSALLLLLLLSTTAGFLELLWHLSAIRSISSAPIDWDCFFFSTN